ncbi:MAG: SGNH/GDSL hydrolase family protein [Desulfobacca sp.]|uniref:SGNH/GDSL hydrolase family protein n=1 Tax=Desulfobacca sp. TaxID=2067990 RepID=UPI00404B5966
MSTASQPTQQNWFSRHPKTTLSAVLAVLLIFLTLLTEKILAWRQPTWQAGIQRYIRLREYPPYFSQYILPPAAELALADNLAAKPYLLRIDGRGFIIPSQIHEKPEVTLVFLGGSSTACGYMGEEERFPYLAGRLLEASTGKKVNSYNSGVGGNNSWHSLNILANKIIPLKPDLVLLCHNINDLTILLLEGSYWSDNPSRSQIVTVIPSVGGSFREIRDLLIPHLTWEIKRLSQKFKETWRRRPEGRPDEFARVRGRVIHYDAVRLRAAFRRNLELFISLCRLQQLQPVLLTQAHRLKEDPDPVIKASLRDLEERQGLPYTEYRQLFLAFNEEIRAAGRANGVLVIDLAEAIPPEKEYLYDIVHFTANGSGRAAEVIAAALRSHLAAPPAP